VPRSEGCGAPHAQRQLIRLFAVLLFLAAHEGVAQAQQDRVIAEDWNVLIEHARRSTRPSEVESVAGLPRLLADDPDRLIALAERLGSAGASEMASAVALRWLIDIETSRPDVHAARELARARVLENGGHAEAALEIVGELAAAADASAEVQHLHARLLAKNDRHEASLEAYDRYLARVPDDREARREQARVAGRAGNLQLAERLYADLARRYPGDLAVGFEAQAKRLFYASMWPEAERAYQRWLDVEPLDEEAALELADTLVAQGRLLDARGVYDSLSRRGGSHEAAHLAKRALEERRAPSGSLATAYSSSHGYDGQRSLVWSEIGGRVLVPLPDEERRAVSVSASSLVFANRGRQLSAYGANAEGKASYRWGSFEGAAGLVRGAQELSYWQGRADATVALNSAVGVRLSVARTPLLENLSTVRDGVSAWGPTLTVSLTSAETEIAASAGTAWVGSNTQKTARATLSQRVRRGTNQLRLISGFDHVAWSESDPRFFSPSGLERFDAGAEWTRWLRLPKFHLDRRNSIALRYVVGVDSDGELYHQPHARVSLDHRRIAIEAESSWVESKVYRSLGLRLGVRIGG
jgi:tetratricopeptide (TPR) repeat protein